ncbi:hypothetical protein PISL3812_05313 [Talaromyces islandicus]|uniref:Ubiquitin-conjugating enzyme E2-binding protein n=1 Tax=Talaromyces islandicus TaxID=28573 RepID=A0A0U1LY61_TALIS|nr:hypothetical protein PISL3812_05313 [Talaromyces islandicus]
MPDTSSIFLHAELLPNIRQLTVHVSLPIPSSSIDLRASTITLSESRRAVTVYTVHGTGDEKQDLLETLKLPARVTEASRRNLTFAGHQVESGGDRESTNSTEYSFRLQVDDYDTSLITVKNNGLHEDDFVPWTAKDMSPHSMLHCRSCSQEILGRLQRQASSWVWKDLPSGNWAEMMDFWHCHKPDVHVDEKDEQRATDDQNASVKGYGASNRVVALPGTVLVDVASFLVAESDCYNIKRSQASSLTTSGFSSNTARANIDCKRCGTIVGMEDPAADGLRLYKSNISVRHSETTPYESYPTEIITSAQLLELINREGVRRFVIHAGQQDGILVWTFNPDLRYSSASADHSIVTRRAMKVLYQELANVEKILEPEKGTAVPLSLEELFLPASIYGELIEALKSSTEVLPASARIFREWNVAFLSRTQKSIMMPENDETIITWEQWEHSPLAACGYSKLLEGSKDEELPDYPCSYHMEEINYDSPNNTVPIISDSVGPIMSTVPELSVSESSSPSDDPSSYDPWRDADDIPTRPPSALLLQDCPPLARCREDPAMGHPEDVIILDLDDDSVAYHWQLCSSSGGEGTTTQDWSRSSSFSFREAHEYKDDDHEKWPIAISSPVIEPAYPAESALVNWTTLSETPMSRI